MNTFVTIIDEKLVNQIAAKLLVLGLEKHKIKFDNFFILSPSADYNISQFNWFTQKGCLCRHYDLVNSADPYYVKFLLKRFIEDYDVKNSHQITYLDPDHIIMKDFLMPTPDNNSLFVSSEDTKKKLKRNKSNNILHFNTSLISGSKIAWSKAVKKWNKHYDEIIDSVTFRYREEIAFSMSAICSGVNLKKIPSNVQCCFSNSDNNCSLIHYGGEYVLSKKIKEYLLTGKEDIFCVSPLELNYIEKKTIKEVVSFSRK